MPSSRDCSSIDGGHSAVFVKTDTTTQGNWQGVYRSGLYQVPASGGELKPVDMSAVKPGDFQYPQFLPGGDDFLFLLDPEDEDGAEVYLATLSNGKAMNVRLLMKSETAAWYTPAGGGRMLSMANHKLGENVRFAVRGFAIIR